MNKKYVIHSDHIKAKDGDIHFITADQIMRLYRVSPAECIVAKDGWERGYTDEYLKELIHLYPRTDGNYATPPIKGKD